MMSDALAAACAGSVAVSQKPPWPSGVSPFAPLSFMSLATMFHVEPFQCSRTRPEGPVPVCSLICGVSATHTLRGPAAEIAVATQGWPFFTGRSAGSRGEDHFWPFQCMTMVA